MRRRTTTLVAAAALVLGVTSALPAAHAEDASRAGGLSVWTADVSRDQVPLLLAAGIDGHELSERVPARGTATVEVNLTPAQADALQAKGIRLEERRLTSAATNRVKAAGDGVFRPYSGPGGLREEILETGRAHPDLTKVVSIGKTLNGQDILAVKVSKDARRVRDGKKPAVLYMSNQHAREWITPEMTRRLMHYYLDGYGTNKDVTQIVDSTELWFVLSANPDGYDYTHADPANRLWRKNLRDNNGDGKITDGDGVDLNRNFAFRWGYDNEGSSPDPASETYRGPSAGSEPETKVLDAFEKRIGFEYGINYHSAAQLLLYGVGWQVATPTPDDVVYRSLAGTPQNSAIPGYRPQLSSELYSTNGEADGHASNVNGMAMFTPEMSTCATASRVDPNDEWRPEDCLSSFIFPDDEKLVQQEFAKNIPFALAVAKSAVHPDQPVSPVGIEAPDFVPDAFGTSYANGADQTVSVTARKSVRGKRLNYRIDGGRVHTAPLRAWRGGERFGAEDNLFFDEYRAQVDRAPVGAKVTVWFSGRTADGERTSSEPFTYTVAERARADTLVVAEEGGDSAAAHASTYVQALRASGHRAAVWDVATQGAPHALGTLEHFSSVVWYTGAEAPGGATTLAVRAYLNEGGKLVQAGEHAGGDSVVGRAKTNDFSQYYLGADTRASLHGTSAFAASGGLADADAGLGDAPGNPLEEAGAYTVTSDTLPADEFPQFASAAAGDYPGVRTPFEPYAGEWFAAAKHSDSAWNRLSRTVDLTGVSADSTPSLRFALSYDVEEGYDNVVLEARTPGQDDWTTLPEANGATSNQVPEECEDGFYAVEHPFLRHYLTVGETGCTAEGTTGSWNRFTGSSNGWQEVTFDLSGYAGRTVELSLSYVSDPGTGGWGVFADDARLVVGGQDQQVEGFETGLGPWTVNGAPEGSQGNTVDWARSQLLAHSSAAVTTEDTVLLGFGLEHVSDAGQRARLIDAALDHLSDRR
ncbi:peptidase M14 [Wenjunlia vitaminophila]|uniref:Zinc carboxypeptidase n=1 Tax=Wenjunlia vitaminophila TaxID=76728 RepID=A0A0T6LTS6_WENVI|nr:M14 family metallopeptidase [Wenjunlia vitaminophila]KRV49234.1 peptidase M14 [Wenjunlia vitaminophila]